MKMNRSNTRSFHSSSFPGFFPAMCAFVSRSSPLGELLETKLLFDMFLQLHDFSDQVPVATDHTRALLVVLWPLPVVGLGRPCYELPVVLDSAGERWWPHSGF